MIRASSVLLSYIEGKHCGCWLLVLLTKFGCSKKNSFASRSMKRLPPQEVQPPCFLLICTQAAARWHPKLPIKWYRSICIVSLERGSAVPFVQKKLPRIPLSFYRLGETRSQKEWSNLMDFSGYSDFPELQANLARLVQNFGMKFRKMSIHSPTRKFRYLWSECALDAQTPPHVSKLGY